MDESQVRIIFGLAVAAINFVALFLLGLSQKIMAQKIAKQSSEIASLRVQVSQLVDSTVHLQARVNELAIKVNSTKF